MDKLEASYTACGKMQNGAATLGSSGAVPEKVTIYRIEEVHSQVAIQEK